jgi:hypothetical protein
VATKNKHHQGLAALLAGTEKFQLTIELKRRSCSREGKKNHWRVGHSRLRLKGRSNEAVNPCRREKREEHATAPSAEQKARSALRATANEEEPKIGLGRRANPAAVPNL